MGRPRSAAFRTADLAGHGHLAHVADNLYENLPDDPAARALPHARLRRCEMVKRGWIGDKAGQGFYKKVRRRRRASKSWRSTRRRWSTARRSRRNFASIDSRQAQSRCLRAHAHASSTVDDRAGKLAWELTADTLLYTAATAPEIADDIVNMDSAMRWGFNWEVGPFETWDALGVEATGEAHDGGGAHAAAARSGGPGQRRLGASTTRNRNAPTGISTRTPTRRFRRLGRRSAWPR